MKTIIFIILTFGIIIGFIQCNPGSGESFDQNGLPKVSKLDRLSDAVERELGGGEKAKKAQWFAVKKNQEFQQAIESMKQVDAARIAEIKGQLKQKNISAALILLEELSGGKSGDSLAALHVLTGHVYVIASDYKNALRAYLEADKITPDDSAILDSIAFAYDLSGDPIKAIEYFQKELQITIKTHGKDSPEVVKVWDNLGFAWKALRKYDKALSYFRDSMELLQLKLKELNPYMPLRYEILGNTYYDMGDYRKAVEYNEKALNIGLEEYGANNPYVTNFRRNLGDAWFQLHDYVKAIQYYSQVVDSDSKQYGGDHPYTAPGWNKLGKGWLYHKEYKKALTCFEKALKRELKTFGSTNVKIAMDYINVAGAWYMQGEFKTAVSYYEKALNILEMRLGKTHEFTTACREFLEESRSR